MNRHPVPSPEEIAGLDDEELERLALEWRACASRGTKRAYGVAHALEVELRQRIRNSPARQLPPLASAPRPWWKFWPASPPSGSSNAT